MRLSTAISSVTSTRSTATSPTSTTSMSSTCWERHATDPAVLRSM